MQNAVRKCVRTLHALPTSLADFYLSLLLSFVFSPHFYSLYFTHSLLPRFHSLIRSQLQFRLKREMGHRMWSNEKLPSSRILSLSSTQILLLFFFFYFSDSYFLTLRDKLNCTLYICLIRTVENNGIFFNGTHLLKF